MRTIKFKQNNKTIQVDVYSDGDIEIDIAVEHHGWNDGGEAIAGDIIIDGQQQAKELIEFLSGVASEFYGAIVGVSSSGQAFFISSANDKLRTLMVGSLFENNSAWDTMLLFPKEPGVYSMTIEFQFKQGYSDGYPSPGESTWDFIPSNIEMLYLSKEYVEEYDEFFPPEEK